MGKILKDLGNTLVDAGRKVYEQLKPVLKVERSARQTAQALFFWIRVALLVSAMMLPSSYHLVCDDCGEGNLKYEARSLY